MNSLLIELHNINLNPLAYADDVAITGNSLNDLDSSIKIIERLSHRHQISVNKTNSGIFKIKQDQRTPSNLPPSHRGYPVVQMYKYIRHKVDDDGKLRAYAVLLKNKMNQIKTLMRI